MPGPPPPPPGVPPPPGPPPPMSKMPPMKLGGGGPDSGRNDLLKSIQQGKKLKKTVTVDKSKPLVGKTTSHSAAPPMTNGRGGGNGGGAPQLGGLFAGGMPKLKSAGAPTQYTPKTQDDEPPPTRRPTRPNGGGPALTLEEELAQKFRKKSEPPPPVTAENLRYTQRGPPPQPPIHTMPSYVPQHNNHNNSGNSRPFHPSSNATATTTPTPTNQPTSPNWNYNGPTTATTTTQKLQSQISSLHALSSSSGTLVTSNTSSPSYPSSSPNLPLSVVANKSSLFSNNNNNNNSGSYTNDYNNQAQVHQPLQSQISATSLTSSNDSSSSNLTGSVVKPIPNYGKPNVAPKPPAQQLLNVKTNGRAVSRHHSMKSPRSPPIEVPPNKYGTHRHPPSVPPAMSVEAINRTPRPQVPPPRPPTSKPPPPPPQKSLSQTNLPNLGLSLPREPIGGSAMSLTGGMMNLHQPNSNGHARSSSSLTSNDLPMVPPHRANPPPQPMKGNAPIGQAPTPPTPPQRNTSLKPPPLHNRIPSQPKPANSVNRLVVDLEAKFSQQFHKVTEFPQPLPFLNVEKSYPSRLQTTTTAKQATSVVSNQLKKSKQKQRAPNPPVVKENFSPHSTKTPIDSTG